MARIIKSRWLVLAVLLTLVVAFNGCGKTTSEDKAATEPTTSASKETERVEETQKKWTNVAEITLWWPWGGPSNPQTSFDSEFSNYLAEKIGVRISFSPCQTDAGQAINLFRASKSFPDILLTGSWLDGAIQWAEEGNTIVLNDYFKNSKDYPNLAQISESLLSFFKNDKGQIVCLPAGPPVLGDLNKPLSEKAVNDCMQAYGFFARKDLYQEYNKPLNTVEDVDQFLRWCKGKKALDKTSVIPLGIPRWDPAPAVEWFITPFGGRNGTMVDSQGNVMVPEVSKPYYDMMAQLNIWFRDGLISREIFTDNFDGYEQKVAAAKFGLIYGSSWAIDTYNTRMNNEATAYIPIPYWKAGNVKEFMANPDPVANPTQMGWAQIVVSSASKDPDAAMRFIDYMTSAEGYISGASGAPGKGWNWVKENSVYELTDLGKKLNPAGGNKDWITESGKYGNFGAFQYSLFDSTTVKLEGGIEAPIYKMARDAWQGHTGTLYGHRRPTIDMITPTEARQTAYNSWLPEKGKWILNVMSAKTGSDFDSEYKKGLKKNAELLKTIENETAKSWNEFKAKHVDLKDELRWYGPVERVIGW